MQEFADWLGTTWPSLLISEYIWVVAISQTIHIVGVAVVMISIAVINLRILGVAGRERSLEATASQFMPWIWAAMLALLITGIVQTVAEPGREIMNMTFRIKIVLLIAVCAITFYYSKALRADPNVFDAGGNHRTLAVTLASVSLFLWVGIVVCGRLIAYVGAIYT